MTTTMKEKQMAHFIKDTWPPVREKQPTNTSPTNSVGIGTVLPGLEDDAADIATIKLLTDVIEMRTQLRALEPQLSKMITEFGMRRGERSYREFFLRNALNRQQYTER
jgi:hypothetical protein